MMGLFHFGLVHGLPMESDVMPDYICDYQHADSKQVLTKRHMHLDSEPC